jgi:phenylalanyl-tRNA synthetase alpha chain
MKMMRLREQEAKVVSVISKKNMPTTLEEVREKTGLESAAIMRAALNLKKENILLIEEEPITLIRLTDEGLEYAKNSLPERKMIEALKNFNEEASLEKVTEKAGIPERMSKIAVGWLKKKEMVTLEKRDNKIILNIKEPKKTLDEQLLTLLKEKESLVEEELDSAFRKETVILAKRKLLTRNRRIQHKLTLTEKGESIISKGITILREVSELTPSLITHGEWRRVNLRKYDVEAPVKLSWPGKRQPYNAFLNELKMKLLSFGFKEMNGPLIELMFFNCDALFMPQDHPARDIHDIYFIKKPKYGSLENYTKFLANVKKVHENGWKTGSKGWNYKFSKQISQRLVLRSHGTSISARTLVSNHLEIPGKYFSIARCYRPEVTDRTHLTEFNQVEGIVIGDSLTLRDLLGVLEKFALDIAEADDVRFRPDYFPFTEPSVELQAYKKGVGWMEFGGSGIFRPELTLPLGITVPVIAWGLGVDRLYMMKTGISDIRDLFTSNLKWLRMRSVN